MLPLLLISCKFFDKAFHDRRIVCAHLHPATSEKHVAQLSKMFGRSKLILFFCPSLYAFGSIRRTRAIQMTNVSDVSKFEQDLTVTNTRISSMAPDPWIIVQDGGVSLQASNYREPYITKRNVENFLFEGLYPSFMQYVRSVCASTPPKSQFVHSLIPKFFLIGAPISYGVGSRIRRSAVSPS